MPAAGLYKHFKNQLLEVHQLSDYKKFNVLIKMETMGGRKPSQLLHAMLEFCPVGMEKHLSFHYLYMQQLPQALRTQLGEVQPGDPRGLAARTDRLWSVHAPSGGDGRAGRCGSGCSRQASRQGPQRQVPRTRWRQRRPAGDGG